MARQKPRQPPKAAGRPRKVNQVLLNRMIELRKQGFSCQEIAQKVQRSERTVRRYTRGVHPQVALVTKAKPVDVLAACGKIILYGRDQLELTTQEVDFLFKKLRKTFESRDPLTREWLATDSKARTDFLFNDVLRSAMGEIKIRRWIQRFREQVGSEEMMDEEGNEGGPSADRLLPP